MGLPTGLGQQANGSRRDGRLHGLPTFPQALPLSSIGLNDITTNEPYYGGDRQANRALHLIAVCRLRYCPRTRAYAKRRTAEGKTKREIMRCLKRYIAREVYNSLRADLADTHRQSRPPVATTIICGNPGLGITRNRT